MKQPNQNLIVINGQAYDARSGMLVNASSSPSKKTFSDIAPSKPKVFSDVSGVRQPSRQQHHVTAAKVHRTPQKTHTLLRSGLKRPSADIAPRTTAAATTPSAVASPTQTRRERAASIQRPAAVSHFASHDIAPTPATTPQKVAAEPAASLSLAQFQSQHPAMKSQPAPRTETGSQLKEALIKERMAEAPVNHDDRFQASQHKVNKFFSKQPRLMTAAAGALSVLLLVGYITYLNLPSISMRVAANRAGFAATMPGYKPSGYALNGPVSYSPGQVSLNFNSNTNSDKFTLSQKESNWDSQALLDNYVAKQTGNYLTYQEKGLTIYMYDGKASWVNGGVWYNIHGSADLSSDQILKMATSM